MQRYDINDIKSAASGQWLAIITSLAGIRADLLDGLHHPCPLCGGKDRFSAYKDFAETGGVRCNQCFDGRNADGIATLGWLRDWDFPETLAELGKHLRVKPSGNHKAEPDPAADLQFFDWNDRLAELWCLKKPPIKVHALKLVGARMGTYRKRWRVIAIPIWQNQPGKGKPCGWCLYELNGGKLPRFQKGRITEWVKMKTTYGSQPGTIGKVKLPT